jgi:hypothetical protein
MLAYLAILALSSEIIRIFLHSSENILMAGESRQEASICSNRVPAESGKSEKPHPPGTFANGDKKEGLR